MCLQTELVRVFEATVQLAKVSKGKIKEKKFDFSAKITDVAILI